MRYMMHFIGMKSLPYYVGNLIADYLLFLLPSLGFLALLFIFSIEALIPAWYIILVILLCFGFSLISLTFLLNFIFSKS